MTEAKKTWKSTQALHVKVLLGILIGLWLIALLDFVIPNVEFDDYGIRPRKASGLWGILTAPFLHAGWAHLGANPLPLLVLGWPAMLRGIRVFLVVCVISAIVCGLGVCTLSDWGQEVRSHVGASGVIFGLFGYLLLRAYFERSLGSLLIACAVGFFYGGLFWGLVVPEQQAQDVSWLGHVFGFAGGALAAWALAPASQKAESEKETPHERANDAPEADDE